MLDQSSHRIHRPIMPPRRHTLPAVWDGPASVGASWLRVWQAIRSPTGVPGWAYLRPGDSSAGEHGSAAGRAPIAGSGVALLREANVLCGSGRAFWAGRRCQGDVGVRVTPCREAMRSHTAATGSPVRSAAART